MYRNDHISLADLALLPVEDDDWDTAFLFTDPEPAPAAPRRSDDARARDRARKAGKRASFKASGGAPDWKRLDRSGPDDGQADIAAAIRLAESIDLAPATPDGLPGLETLALAGHRRAVEGRGGATSNATVMRLLIRSPYPPVIAALWPKPDKRGPGRPGVPVEYYVFFLALARELGSFEQAGVEVRSHWHDVVVPEFAAQGHKLPEPKMVKGILGVPGYKGLRHWRDKVVAEDMLGPINVLFTILSLRLHVAIAHALRAPHGTLLDPEPWQILFADSTVMRPASEVHLVCAVCGTTGGCDHPRDLLIARHSRAKDAHSARVCKQGIDYGETKAHGETRGFHNIAIAATNGGPYQRILLGLDVDKDNREEMQVAMPLIDHVLALAGDTWVRALAYDGALRGNHHHYLLRHRGTPVINLPSTASRKAQTDGEIIGSTTRRHGKHKGGRVSTYDSQQRTISHTADDGSPCHHFVICDDGAAYDSRRPLSDLRARGGTRGTLLRPTGMERIHHDDGTYEVVLGFQIACGSQNLAFDAVLTDSRVTSEGVAHSEPIQAFRHFCDADADRWEGTAGIRSNIESIFSWIEKRFTHKDRAGSWDRDHHLLDLIGAGIAINAEAWAHALPTLRDAA